MNIFGGLQAVANIHPIIVHFPIGLLIISTCLFFAGKFNKDFFLAGKWNLIIGSVCAIVAVITGLLGAGAIPHNDEIHQAMGVHRDIMAVTTLLALGLAAYVYFQKNLFQIKRFPLFLGGMVLMVALLTVGADYGGKMVFKYGAGTELFAKLNPDSEDGHDHQHGNYQEVNKEIKVEKHENRKNHHKDEHPHSGYGHKEEKGAHDHSGHDH